MHDMTDEAGTEPNGIDGSTSPAALRPQRRRWKSWAVGAILLLSAVTFYYFAVLGIDLGKTQVFNLFPAPDAIEYFAQANSIAEGRGLHIQIGHELLPSRYPSGFPVLMLPSLKLLPQQDKILAPFRTNQTIGLLLILAAFATYSIVRKPITAGLAALLLATLPGFFTYCRASLSEISASAAIATAFVLVYFGLARKTRWQLYLAAATLGLALNIRLQLIFFAPLLVAMAVLDKKRSRSRWVLDCTGLLAVFAAAAAPAFILNAVQFGSPLRTGYDFWLADFAKQSPFSIRHIPEHGKMFWSQIALSQYRYSVGNLFGTGSYFTPAHAVLVAIGFLFVRPSRFVFAALAGGGSFFVATTMFKYVDPRLYLPLFVLLTSVAVLPLEWASGVMKDPKRVAFAGVLWLIGTAAVAGYPSQSGFPPKRGHWQLRDALAYGRGPKRRTPKGTYAAVKAFLESFGFRPGTVLSDINPVYLNALLPAPFVAAPIDGRHSYRHSDQWRYAEEEAAALVEKTVSHDAPVYALLTFEKHVESTLPRLPKPTGYMWSRAPAASSAAIVFILVRDPATTGRSEN